MALRTYLRRLALHDAPLPRVPVRQQLRSVSGSARGEASTTTTSTTSTAASSESSASIRKMQRLAHHDAPAFVAKVESGAIELTESVAVEYIGALARIGQLNTKKFADVMRIYGDTIGLRLEGAGGEAVYDAFGRPVASSGGGAGGLAAVNPLNLGTPNEPLVVKLNEPSIRTVFWNWVRTIAFVAAAASAFSALNRERSGGGGGGGGMSSIARAMGITTNIKPYDGPTVTFADVQGVDGAKEDLEEIVHYLKEPESFADLGGRLPKGLLLTGPPGTGKTMLAKAVAGEAGVPFFHMSGSEFDEMFVGVGARRVRELFATAKKVAPCIIFIDEIDAMGSKRNPKDHQYSRMTLNQLLVDLDGFSSSDNIVVIAATNFPESLDPALVRPGRFDRNVVVPLPDITGRTKILELYVKKVALGDDADVALLARQTMGFSGAALANLVNEAALYAARKGKDAVSMSDFEFACDKIRMGKEHTTFTRPPEMVKRSAYYEGGLALVGVLTPAAQTVHKVTIIPRGSNMSATSFIPKDDMSGFTRKELLAMLDTKLAGRVAEELFFGKDDVASDAASDLRAATDLATRMVTVFGMVDDIGRVDLNSDGISPETRSIVEGAVQKLLDESRQRVGALLKKHEKDLHDVASGLLEKETLTGGEVEAIVKANKGWFG